MSPLERDGDFRTFVWLWASQSVSVIGTALTFFAVNIWLAQTLYPRPDQRAALAFALSATSLAFAIPTVLAAPIAGAWADRHDRKRTMMTMNLASGALSVALVMLIATHRLGLAPLLVFMALYCVCGAFHAASFETSYAMLVPGALLARATGMMQSTMALAAVIAPSVAAGLMAVPAWTRAGRLPNLTGEWIGRLGEGAAVAVAVDALSFLLAAAALVFLLIPSPPRGLPEPGATRAGLLDDVRSGWVYIARRPPLLWLLASFAAVNFVLGPITVMQPLLIKFNLAADWKARGFRFESALALLATVHGLGGICGAVAVSLSGGLRTRRIRAVLLPLCFAGLLIALFGGSDSLVRSAALLFLLGAIWPIVSAHSQAIWMAQTPREIQGRVFSVRRLIAQFTFPLGATLAGWMGGRFDPGASIAVLGVILAGFGLSQLFNRQLMRVEDKAWLDRNASPTESPG